MQTPDMETLTVEKDGGIAWLYMNRPDKRNAMNQAMFSELGVAARYLEDDPDVRVAILTGRGKAFCAGLDLSSMDLFKDLDVNDFRRIVRQMQRNFRAFELIEKPVIAMVNGPALGAGTEIALSCDMIIASTGAVFGLLEVGLGLVTDLGATQRLPRYIGVHRAKELILTGKRIDAVEAERIGLVNAVYPPEELISGTLELAGRLSSLSGVALGLCKIAIDRGFDGSMESGLEHEAQSQSICLSCIMEMMKAQEPGED
jgi:enoyl-CoA hydratase/carnithine racemase